MDMLEFESGPEVQSWIDYRLNEGRHIDAAEYLRDLIRRDMESNLDFGADENAQKEGSSCK